jgi:hypothetical protein
MVYEDEEVRVAERGVVGIGKLSEMYKAEREVENMD